MNSRPEKLRELCYLLLLKSVLGLGRDTLSAAQKYNLQQMLKTIEGRKNFTDAVMVLNQVSSDDHTPLCDLLAPKKDYLERNPIAARSLPTVGCLAAGITGLAGGTSILTPLCFLAMCSSGFFGRYDLQKSSKKEAQELALSLLNELVSVNQPVDDSMEQDHGKRRGQDSYGQLSSGSYELGSGSIDDGMGQGLGVRQEQNSFDQSPASGGDSLLANTEVAAPVESAMNKGQGGDCAGNQEQENRKSAQSMADRNIREVGENIDKIQAELKNGEDAIRLSLDSFFERHTELQRLRDLFERDHPPASRTEFIEIVSSNDTMRRGFLKIIKQPTVRFSSMAVFPPPASPDGAPGAQNAGAAGQSQESLLAVTPSREESNSFSS